MDRDENYIGDWAMRMIDREDILDANAGVDSMSSQDAWLNYVDRMEMRDRQHVLSDRQVNALIRGRDEVVGALEQGGIRAHDDGRWRDLRGRFVARTTVRSLVRRLFGGF